MVRLIASSKTRWYWLTGLTALLVIILARPYAGGWNDGSRLATVETLVDHRTLAIDDSIYIRVPAERSPYTPGDSLLAQHGTADKMFIRGHYYSDKSPVPAVVMASVYQTYRWLGGPSAAERPDWFARLLTWCFAGLPLLVALWCFGRSMEHLRVPEPWPFWLTASFVLGTMSLAYTQHVNNHILLLGTVALLVEAIVRPWQMVKGRLAWIGAIAGFGYTIDLGTGPALLLSVGLWSLWSQSRHRWRSTAFVVLGALPFVLTHHALNYMVAGTWTPANAHPEFFRWPGSPFNASNMTGGWVHSSWGAGVLYSFDMLFGQKGFLMHTPALVVALFAWPWVWRQLRHDRPLVLALGVWCLLTWLLYAATSRNLSGLCISIRWFVPLLVPGYVLLALAVRDLPRWRKEIGVTLVGGALLALGMTVRGPWASKIPGLYYWPLAALTLAIWGVLAWQRLTVEMQQPTWRPVSLLSFWTSRLRLRPTVKKG